MKKQMSNKEAAKILKKSLDACTKAIEQALKEKNYKAVEKSMRTAFAFMKGHRALKKQIPQKPVIRLGEGCDCPVCGSIINECADSYCSNCGQRIDWEE